VLYRDGSMAHLTLAEWTKATGQKSIDGKIIGLSLDPALVLPPSGNRKMPTDPRKLVAMPFGRLGTGSPCVGAGRIVPDGAGPQDFFGNRIAPGKRPSLGAHEPQK
jgi:hypothetical protein